MQLWTTTSTAQDLKSKTIYIIEAVTKLPVQDMFGLLDALAQLCMMSKHRFVPQHRFAHLRLEPLCCAGCVQRELCGE